MGLVSSAIASKGVAALASFGIILYAVHIVTILTLGRLAGIPFPDLLLASNANIGNHATASSLAVSKGWDSRVLPAVLVGTLGNSVGTFVGLWLFILLKKYY